MFCVSDVCLQDLQRTGQLPTPAELAQMKADLSFKENEMQKSEATASGLAGGEYKQYYCKVASPDFCDQGCQTLANKFNWGGGILSFIVLAE